VAPAAVGRYLVAMPQGPALALAIGVSAFVLFFLIGRLTRRKAQPMSTTTDSLTHHVEEQIILMVSDRLRIDDEELAATLRKEPDPGIVEKVTKDVRAIELVYEKKHGKGPARYDLGVEVHFEDGHLDRKINEVSVAWLPEDVSQAFAKTGAARVHRAWTLPWQNANNKVS